MTTKVYLNTWENYNDGFLGYGWMEIDQAIDFIESDPDRAGGEWFIADVDNYLGVEFNNLEYANVIDTLETIKEQEYIEEMNLNRKYHKDITENETGAIVRLNRN